MFKFETLTLLLFFIAFAWKKHLLTFLLLIEVLSLSIIFLSIVMGLDIFFSLIMICVGACEGAVGLGTMIGMSRVNGLERY